MDKHFIIACNWKMNLSFDAAQKFAKQHYDGLVNMAHHKNITLVLCPSHESLYSLENLFTSTSVHIGAQDCSSQKSGNFTGDVSAQSIEEMGCCYCIIGHSERRQHNKETDTTIAEKLHRLLEIDLIPIICIGETKEEYENNMTKHILEQQLKPLLETIKNHTKKQDDDFHTICLAYEPVWAIGTGMTPDKETLEDTFSWINEYLSTSGNNARFHLLYGGSVNGNNIEAMKNTTHVDGFLIGGASLDFKKLEKIVDCVSS